MERLFSPYKCYQKILVSRGLPERARSFEELLLNVSFEELLSAERALTYGDLYAMLRNEDMFAWLTPYAAVVRQDNRDVYHWPFRLSFNTDDDKGMIAFSHSLERLLVIGDVVLRLLAASDVRSVMIHKLSLPEFSLISAPALGYLLEQCQSLKSLKLIQVTLDENHCRAIDTYSRPGLEILLTG
jgi:hypothetical protein